jgi:rhodanese-related sulfurtransferase
MNHSTIRDVFDRVDPTEAKRRQDDGSILVDVRELDEFEQGHPPGAILIPLSAWAERYQELPTDREVLLICAGGVRSARAAEFAAKFGYTCTNVEGGLHAWFAHGLPVVFPGDEA